MNDVASYFRLPDNLEDIGYSMIIAFADAAIGAEFASMVRGCDSRVVLVSADVETRIARLRFQYLTSMPASTVMVHTNFDAILSKCDIIAKERTVVDRRFKIPPSRLPNDLIPICRLLPAEAIVAELGSFAGEGAEQFRKSGKVSRIVCIDHWQGESMDGVRAAFEWRMRNPRLLGEVSVLAMKTSDAAPLIANESLDMVYVDASHDYASVKEDIENWLPKVKRGGFIAGHDWHLEHFGVVRAVVDTLGRPDGIFPDTSWYKRKA